MATHARWDQVGLRARELRQKQTPAEQALWACLRHRSLNGLKFRRQHPIGPYIADFYCAQFRLVVELDGGIHSNQVEQDQERAGQLERYGYRVSSEERGSGRGPGGGFAQDRGSLWRKCPSPRIGRRAYGMRVGRCW